MKNMIIIFLISFTILSCSKTTQSPENSKQSNDVNAIGTSKNISKGADNFVNKKDSLLYDDDFFTKIIEYRDRRAEIYEETVNVATNAELWFITAWLSYVDNDVNMGCDALEKCIELEPQAVYPKIMLALFYNQKDVFKAKNILLEVWPLLEREYEKKIW